MGHDCDVIKTSFVWFMDYIKKYYDNLCMTNNSIQTFKMHYPELIFVK
jgi:hypothetical protein